MTRRTFVIATVVLTSLALVVPACTSRKWDTSGINDTTPTTVERFSRDDAGVTASLTRYLSTVGDDLDEWAAPVSDARCAAERLVRRFGSDHLLELGFDPQQPSLALSFPTDERNAAINVLVGCIDFSQAMLEMLSSYLKLPLTQSDCMAKGFDRLGLVRDMAGALVDGVEPDPFANSNRFGGGVASLAVVCMEEEDLLPSAPMPPLPGPSPDAPTTSVAAASEPPSDDLPGIVEGGPLDVTTTTVSP